MHFHFKKKKDPCEKIIGKHRKIQEIVYDGPIIISLVKGTHFRGCRRAFMSIMYVVANILLGLVLWNCWIMATLQEPIPVYGPRITPSTNKTTTPQFNITTGYSEADDTEEPEPSDNTTEPTLPPPAPYAVSVAAQVTLRYSVNLGHYTLCSVGFVLFLSSGIMAIGPMYGASKPLIAEHRRLEHMFLIYIGMALMGLGFALNVFAVGPTNMKWLTQHALSGIAVFLIGAICILSGWHLKQLEGLNGVWPKIVRLIHSFLGILVFLAGFNCLLSGIELTPYYTDTLKKQQVHDRVFKIILPLILAFGGLVLVRPIMTCVGLNLFFSLKYQPCVCKHV